MKLSTILRQAEKLRLAGDKNYWGIARLACRVVEDGEYGDCAVDQFAKTIKRSGKTVYNLAGAWETFVTLKATFDIVKESDQDLYPQYKHFWQLRDQLPYSHFKRMGDLMRRLEFSPIEAISYLIDAAELGHSADRMAEDVEAEQKKPKLPDKDAVFKKSTSKAVYELEQASMNAPSDTLASVVIAASKVIKQALDQPVTNNEPEWYKPARIVRSLVLDMLQVKMRLPDSLYNALVEFTTSLDEFLNSETVA